LIDIDEAFRDIEKALIVISERLRDNNEGAIDTSERLRDNDEGMIDISERLRDNDESAIDISERRRDISERPIRDRQNTISPPSFAGNRPAVPIFGLGFSIRSLSRHRVSPDLPPAHYRRVCGRLA
jgi:hypothetical protein